MNANCATVTHIKSGRANSKASPTAVVPTSAVELRRPLIERNTVQP